MLYAELYLEDSKFVLLCKLHIDYSRFKIFIRHIHNYTEYNQQWNVSQVHSMDSVIMCNTNTREYT